MADEDRDQAASATADQPVDSENTDQLQGDTEQPVSDVETEGHQSPADEQSTSGDEEVLIGGRFRPDQVGEIDETVRYADYARRELADTKRELSYLKQQSSVPPVQQQPKSIDEEYVDLQRRFNEGEIDESAYTIGTATLATRAENQRHQQQTAMQNTSQRAQSLLIDSYPNAFTPGSDQHRAVAEIVQTHYQEFGEDLTQLPTGGIHIKRAMDAVYGPGKAADSARKREQSRATRVGQHLGGVDTSTPNGNEGKSLVIPQETKEMFKGMTDKQIVKALSLDKARGETDRLRNVYGVDPDAVP
tara:strand:- start:86 stop:994 length:909 start_codon:yes stop_codon:yes gene_type:complete